MKVIGKAIGKIDVKRLYLPGIKIVGECEKCKASHEHDLANDYLNYPKVGEVEAMHFYCHLCDHEWSQEAIIDIKIKFLED